MIRLQRTHLLLRFAPSAFTSTERLLDTVSGLPPRHTMLNDCAGSLGFDIHLSIPGTPVAVDWSRSQCNYDIRF